MVDVVPFKGLLYNQDVTGPLERATAPPYDVISPDAQDALYEKSPHNVVRLILGKQFPEDTDNDNRYTRSAKVFGEWIENSVLTQDKEPGFYVYSQDYSFDGVRRSRIGFFARVRVEDFSTGNICPHEFTLAKAKKDRAHLIEACRANFSPIFGLFSDPDGGIDKKLSAVTNTPPLATIEDPAVTHRLWRLDDKETLASISQAFRDKRIYIADGHHRYETALAYFKKHGDTVPDSAHVMMFLTNLDSESMSIFPIHRLVRCPQPFDRESFLSKVSAYFNIEPLPQDFDADKIKAVLKAAPENGVTFCAYLGEKHFYRMELTGNDHVLPYMKPDEPEELKVLGVAQLHFLILRSILGIDTKDPKNQQYVSYKVDVTEAIERVDAKEFDLAFFMNPTPIAQVRRLAENGVRLPQKATFFYPKLLSGLVINRFSHD